MLPVCGFAASVTTFEQQVRPILKTHCFHCHGEDGEVKGGLDVRLARFILKGGEDGAAIKPGDAGHSLMIEKLKNGEMPKGKSKLSDKDIATIEQWINQGAKTARPEPEKLGPEQAFTDEERAWWSLQPVKKPAVPVASAPVDQSASASVKSVKGTTVALTNRRTDSLSSNPIDSFIVEKLAKNGLTFSSKAEPVTFIRRATFDLIGLPPTPEETEAFVAESIRNPSAAVRNLIDRLLGSAAYGERWGRHWLDVAGYSDSDGYTEKDSERAWAWKFRDYVVKAFNDNKPFDQFVREQLAGDEMMAPRKGDLSAGDIEKLTATGFLRMAPDGTATMNDLAARNSCIADTVKIVSTALYGLTIACAQCHDHRYDPITQADYYRLRAVFEPGFDTVNWRAPSSRLVSLLTTSQKAESAKIEAEAKKLDAVREVKAAEFIEEVLTKEIAKAPENLHADLRKAYKTLAAKRTPAQTKMLKEWPRINQLSSGSLYLYDTTYKTKHADELKAMTAEATKVRAKKPVEEFVQAFSELPKTPTTIPATFIFNRGNIDQPKDKVKPGELTVLAGQRSIEFAEKAPALPTTGRRLAFANSITDGKHPLLARVFVNRVWMHHFGKGIVPSVGDLGKLGDAPSHPEMLDWLASDFVEHGWDIKRLHRQMMTSQTYAQTSKRNGTSERIDPDNRLLSRMNVQRLEAEVIRDSLLSIAGKLSPKVGGKPVPVTVNEEGQNIIGIDTRDTAGRQTGKYLTLNGEEYRRSIYVQARRSMPLEMFAAFDAPAMTDANCASRPVTTVSPQSLLLMNNTYMREHAQDFAARLLRECGPDLGQQIRRAWKLCYSREPSMSDVQSAEEFLKAQTAHYKKTPAKLDHVAGPADKTDATPELLSLTALCHALMSANAFLYVD